MNYKTSTFLLAIISVGLIVFMIYNKNTMSDVIEPAQQQPLNIYEGHDALLNYIAQRMDSVRNQLGQVAGKPISPSQAHRMIRDYQLFMQSNFPGYDSTKAIYGFVFDLNAMKDFMNRIENYNAAPHSPEETISGVRVYNGRTNLSATSYNDVFLIPVKGPDFVNFYKVDSQYDKDIKGFNSDDPSILNSSLPCPTLCNP